MTFALSALRGQPVYIELAERCRAQSILISSIPNLGDGGSGTFATYKNLCGIISATHVFADYIDTPMIFSPLQKTDNPTIFLNTSHKVASFPRGIGSRTLRLWAFHRTNSLQRGFVRFFHFLTPYFSVR